MQTKELWPVEKCYLKSMRLQIIHTQTHTLCNPDIRELSGPEKKYLISGFGLFYIHTEKIYLISGFILYLGFLLSRLHCIYKYIYFIKHNRHFMSTYFLLDPFEFPYYFYCILGELIYVLSIVACIPSTRDTCNYGQYINQFPQNTIKVIREFERIQKKICRHKMSIMFNEICINEEMLPKYKYIYIYM